MKKTSTKQVEVLGGFFTLSGLKSKVKRPFQPEILQGEELSSAFLTLLELLLLAAFRGQIASWDFNHTKVIFNLTSNILKCHCLKIVHFKYE